MVKMGNTGGIRKLSEKVTRPCDEPEAQGGIQRCLPGGSGMGRGIEREGWITLGWNKGSKSESWGQRWSRANKH